VIAAAAVSFSVVACIAAWIIAHPGKSPPPPVVVNPPLVHPDATPLLVHAPKPIRDDMRLTVNSVEPSPRSQPERVRLIDLPAPASPEKPAYETYGTSVHFLSNPAEAAALARREKKLLFVLHVSGNFEESCFT
jgi:hypothetical protein